MGFFKKLICSIYIFVTVKWDPRRGVAVLRLLPSEANETNRNPKVPLATSQPHLPGPSRLVVARAGGVSSFYSEESPPRAHRGAAAPGPEPGLSRPAGFSLTAAQ